MLSDEKLAETRKRAVSFEKWHVEPEVLAADVLTLLDEVAGLRAQREAVLALHCKSDSALNLSDEEVRNGARWCAGCGNRPWPCASVRALGATE